MEQSIVSILKTEAHKAATKFKMPDHEKDCFNAAYLALWASTRRKALTGNDLKAYARIVARRVVYQHIVRAKAPVSSSWHGLHEIVKLQNEELLPETGVEDVEIEKELAEARWQRKIKRRINFILKQQPNSHLARQFILDELSAEEVAKRNHCHINKVYHATRLARRAIKNDARIQKLWERR